jgi:hypothetical protein
VRSLSEHLAFSQGKKGLDKNKHGIQGLNIGKGAEIAGTVLHDITGSEKPGKCFVGNPYNRVGFSILQVDVIPGGVLFYQGVFQEQGFVFTGNNDRFDGSDMGQEGPGFYILVAAEIGGEPVSQNLSLSYIYDGSRFVLHKVYPRFKGCLFYESLKAGIMFHILTAVHHKIIRYYLY